MSKKITVVMSDAIARSRPVRTAKGMVAPVDQLVRVSESGKRTYWMTKYYVFPGKKCECVVTHTTLKAAKKKYRAMRRPCDFVIG